ncbi:MAG: hypothetical protein HWE27_14035 [Gammaproteobacteria bacterium]|nr:hypothetical protein [Gammaproteobacteria bacterium]
MESQTVKEKGNSRIWLAIVAAIILFIIIKHYVGETTVYHEKVKFVGKEVDVTLTYNYVDYWLKFGHLFEFGDNKSTYTYTFAIDQYEYEFEHSRQMIILNEWDGSLYFVGFPYHRFSGRYFFEVFKAKKGTNDWQKLIEEGLPKEVALRNIWILSPYNKSDKGLY